MRLIGGIFKWSRLEGLANTEVTRIIGIIPFVGYLILFNDQITGGLSFHLIAGGTNGNGSSFFIDGVTKLRLAFFGSISLLFANVLFRLGAPRVIESSKSGLSFSDRVLGSYSQVEIVEIEKAVLAKEWIDRTNLIETYEKQKGRMREIGPRLDKYANFKALIADEAPYIRILAREWWENEDNRWPWLRCLVMSLSISGYLMLALPTIDIAQAVIIDILVA